MLKFRSWRYKNCYSSHKY